MEMGKDFPNYGKYSEDKSQIPRLELFTDWMYGSTFGLLSMKIEMA